MESSLLLSSLTSPTASVLLLGLTDSRAYTTPSADGQKCELYVKQETGRLCLTNVQLAKVPSCAQWTPASPHPTYPVPTRPQSSFSRALGCCPWGREESDTTERLHFHALEKEMATHSSVLAWRIPGTGEPCGLLSMGSHRVGHD